jgi:hypothetical protein
MKLTIYPTATTIGSPAGPVKLRAFQIAVPVRLSVHGVLSQEFPAILDTGLNHNFAIRAEHLHYWAGATAKQCGIVSINGYPIPIAQADLVLEGSVLPLPDGIAIYPDNVPFAPRLPTLGLRALVRNNIRVLIDGTDVTLG